jgi:hypothetical protein
MREAQAGRPELLDPAYFAKVGTIFDGTLGPTRDYMAQIRALLPPDAPPAPVQVVGHAGSYSGHDPAVDLYPNGEWGPHDRIPLVVPKAGRIERYTFGTPLPALAATDPEYAERHRQLFEGWICIAREAHGERFAGTLQQMDVLVYWPDGGLDIDGVHLAAVGVGHVLGSSIPVGRVTAGTTAALTYDSGIRFERQGIAARAAHGHFIAFRSGVLSPNGDAPGWLAIKAFGFPAPRRHGVPGPTDYLGGGFVAGRPKSDWAGRAIPPIPA